MQSSGISHSPFSPAPRRDPVRAAEDDIRRYLIRLGILSSPEARRGNAHPSLCFLAIYAAIALIIVLGSLWLAQMECDPMFMDRGLTAACRIRAGAIPKIVGPAGNSYPGFMPSTLLQ
jgi:hypothetical protein